jgi:hypothetical protein
MVHEKCRSEWYTYRTGEGELEQVSRFAVPEDKVGLGLGWQIDEYIAMC